MALGSNHKTGTTQAVFIPEIWSDDVIAAYKKNLVLLLTQSQKLL